MDAFVRISDSRISSFCSFWLWRIAVIAADVSEAAAASQAFLYKKGSSKRPASTVCLKKGCAKLIDSVSLQKRLFSFIKWKLWSEKTASS